MTRDRISLEQAHYASSTINLGLAAIRRLAYEAAYSGLLSPDLAADIRRVKGQRNTVFESETGSPQPKGKGCWAHLIAEVCEANVTMPW